MNQEELIIEEYKIYSQIKENFVNRNFTTNKFYLVLVLVIILTMFMTKDLNFAYGLTSILVFSAMGMAISTMWWINIDSYNFLIKIKLREVLENLEMKLPVQPNKMEIEAINSIRINKREFLFADIQKCIAMTVFILFFVLFTHDLLLMFIA